MLLLKSEKRKISNYTNDLSGEIIKKFVSNDSYYVLTNNQLNRLRKDKNFILSLFIEKKEKMELFAK